jgi:hypothetical protein
MKRILMSFGLGLLAPLVAFFGAELFEEPGRNPPMETIAEALAVGLYCAACQFWIARRSLRRAPPGWTCCAAMMLAIGAIFLGLFVAEGRLAWRYFAAPTLVGASIGTFAGMVLGRGAGCAGAA